MGRKKFMGLLFCEQGEAYAANQKPYRGKLFTVLADVLRDVPALQHPQ